MKKLIVSLVFCGFLAMFWCGLFVTPVSAIPGDINNSGTVETGDIVYLINYLYKNSPPPVNPIDADVDGSSGINMGDVMQLIGYCYTGCSLIPYSGTSVKLGSKILLSSDLISPMASGPTDTISVKILLNEGPDLVGFVIPLSYADQPGEVEVTLDSVSFYGSIIPSSWNPDQNLVRIDNTEKTVLISSRANFTGITPIDSGTTGVLATLYFNKTANGTPHSLSITEIPPSHSLMLISAYCADGTPPSRRITVPVLSLGLVGDANCDGRVDIGDIVYSINYLFRGGPPPCGS